MNNAIDQRVADTTAPAGDIPQSEHRLRAHDANPKSIAVMLALVVAGAAVVVAALGGGGTISSAACEERVRDHVRTVLLGVDPAEAGKPVTCSGIPHAEVEQMRGRILGAAVAG